MSFTKADLKTGMILEFEQGIKGRVLLGTRYGDVVVARGLLLNLEDGYNEDLTAKLPMSKVYQRVLKVYNPACVYDCYGETKEDTEEVVWERLEPKKYKVGQRFCIEGGEYILTKVSPSLLCLINVLTGNRWRDATQVACDIVAGTAFVSQESLELLIGHNNYTAL